MRSRVILATLLCAAPAAVGAQDPPRLRPVATIGCSDCGGAAEFASINDVAVLPAGGVIVISSQAPMLRAFDASGRPLWTAGRDGAGPGEYRFPMRIGTGPSGLQVIDMTLRRVSRLTSDGAFRTAVALEGFPAGVARRAGADELLVLTDDFRGGKVLHRWTFGDSARRIGPIPPPSAPAGPLVFASIAVGPSGEIAVAPDGDAYLIHRLDPSGRTAGAWQRDIPRVARTPDEIAALQRIQQKARARAAAEGGRGRGGVPPMPAPGDLKPHMAIDGLRFDDAGRLWVRTMRGDHTRTVLDVFAPGGAWLGEVIVPYAMNQFSLAGRWLAGDVEWDDGTRRVAIWEIGAGR